MIIKFNEKKALSLLMDFLSIEGVTGKEKLIAKEVEHNLISNGIPKKYISFEQNNCFLVSFLFFNFFQENFVSFSFFTLLAYHLKIINYAYDNFYVTLF